MLAHTHTHVQHTHALTYTHTHTHNTLTNTLTHTHSYTHSHTQLFSLSPLYVAACEVKPLEAGQLALTQDQSVRVIDPTREDWWLVGTVPDDGGESPLEGWVLADKLQQSPGKKKTDWSK